MGRARRRAGGLLHCFLFVSLVIAACAVRWEDYKPAKARPRWELDGAYRLIPEKTWMTGPSPVMTMVGRALRAAASTDCQLRRKPLDASVCICVHLWSTFLRVCRSDAGAVCGKQENLEHRCTQIHTDEVGARVPSSGAVVWIPAFAGMTMEGRTLRAPASTDCQLRRKPLDASVCICVHLWFHFLAGMSIGRWCCLR